MKKLLVTVLAVSALAFVACKKEEKIEPVKTAEPAVKVVPVAPAPATTAPAVAPAPAPTAVAVEPIGVPACDAYAAAMKSCSEKAPAESRAAMDSAAKAQVDTWRSGAATPEAKTTLETGCKAALAAAKTAHSASCPDVKWE
jgi:hypothetical protein